MPTSTTLNFLQILLLMEAMEEYVESIRSQVAAGDTDLQTTLSEVDRINDLLNTGIITIEPAPVSPHLMEAVRRFSSMIGSRIMAGEIGLQETLDEVAVIQRHLDAGKLRSVRELSMELTLSPHQAYLMREAVTGLANALGIKVAAGDYWLTRTLDDVEQLEELLIQGNDINIDHNKIGEAA